MRYYKSFYDTAPCGFYTTKISDGRFVKANKFLVNMFGFDTLSDMKKNIKSTDLYDEGKRDELLALIEENGIVTDFEVEINLPSGDKKWVIVTAKLCKKRNCIEGSVIDITERKQLELLTKFDFEKMQKNEIEEVKKLRRLISERLQDFDKSRRCAS